jgi:hypothetical protein
LDGTPSIFEIIEGKGQARVVKIQTKLLNDRRPRYGVLLPVGGRDDALSTL